MPSEEVHEIIDRLCRDNEISQSKVTGLLVEEALKSRGVLCYSFQADKENYINYSFEQEKLYKNNKTSGNFVDCTINNKALSENIKMMHEFIEFKYFKKVMKQNNNILD